MKGPKGLAVGLIGASALMLALVAGLMSYSGVSAQAPSPGAAIGSLTQDVGAQGAVNLDVNIAAPGLGAFTVEIAYDGNVVSATACTPAAIAALVGCSPLTANPLIVNGASTAGLSGNTTVAQITFKCDALGSSALTLTVTNLADNTAQNIAGATVVNGSVTCAAVVAAAVQEPAAAAPAAAAPAAAAALPATGGEPSDSGAGALPWLAAIAGALALMGAGSGLWLAYQRRRVR